MFVHSPAAFQDARKDHTVGDLAQPHIQARHGLTSALRRNNETIPATVSAALFEHATDADTDLPIKRALLSLPGVRPLHVFDVAVTKNDTELAEHLLQKGAKVDRLTGDVRRQTGPEMQKLLHAAEAISKLYPPQRGNARLMPKSRMQKALESFNLPEAIEVTRKICRRCNRRSPRISIRWNAVSELSSWR